LLKPAYLLHVIQKMVIVLLCILSYPKGIKKKLFLLHVPNRIYPEYTIRNRPWHNTLYSPFLLNQQCQWV